MKTIYAIVCLLLARTSLNIYLEDTDFGWNKDSDNFYNNNKKGNCEGEKSGLQKKLNDCLDAKTSSDRSVQQFQIQITTLTQESSSIRIQLSTCQDQLKSNNNYQNEKDLKKQIEVLIKQNRDYEREVNELRSLVNKLQRENQEANNNRDRIAQLQAENASLTQQVNSLTAQVSQLRAENEAQKGNEATIQELNITITNLQRQLDQARADEEECEQDYANIRIEINNCRNNQGDNEKLKKQVADLQAQLDQAKSRCSAFEARIDILEKKVNQCEKQSAEYQTLLVSFNSLQARFTDIQEKYNKCTSENASLNITITQLNVQISSAQTNCQNQTANLRAQITALNANIDRLTAIIDQLRNAQKNCDNFKNCTSDIAYWKDLYNQCQIDIDVVYGSGKKNKNDSRYGYDQRISIGSSLDGNDF